MSDWDYLLKQNRHIVLPTQIAPNIINELIELGAKMKEDEMKEKEIEMKEKESELKKNNEDNMVNSPSHYNQNSIETIDIIKDSMSAEEFKGFLKGNIIKYVSRAEFKGNETEDLQKARWYLNRWIRETLNLEG